MLINEINFQRHLVKPLLWSILAALTIYGISAISSDLDIVGASAEKLGIVGWLIILGLSLVNYSLRFVRWELYLSQLDSRVPIHLSFAYYISGFAFTMTPGKAGEAVRSFYLKPHGVAYVHSLAAFFVERFVDLVAMVLLALAAALAFPAYQWPVVVITVLIIAVLPLFHAQSTLAFLDRQRTRLPSERLRSVGSRMLDMIRSASSLLKIGPLYVGLTLALLAWGAEGVAFHVILETLGLNTSLLLAVGIYSISVLAGALTFLPGGLGSTEAVMILLLKVVGGDTPTAVAATIICRLATLWFAVVIGGMVAVALELFSKTNRQQLQNVKEEL
jgi:uncharacterized protein (TIRG00374 family)